LKLLHIVLTLNFF